MMTECVLRAVASLLVQVIATNGPSLTPAALDAMTYADAVIREVLRIAPPSASVFRKATVDLEVRGSLVAWEMLQSAFAVCNHACQ